MAELSPPPPPDFTTDRLPRIASRHGLINIELFNELQMHCETMGLPDPDFCQVARVGAGIAAQIAFIRKCAMGAAATPLMTADQHRKYRGQLQNCRAQYAVGQWRNETQRQFLELMFPEVVPRRPG
jgi:hypothetical protein